MAGKAYFRMRIYSEVLSLLFGFMSKVNSEIEFLRITYDLVYTVWTNNIHCRGWIRVMFTRLNWVEIN